MKRVISFLVCFAGGLVVSRLLYSAWRHQADWSASFISFVFAMAFFQAVCVVCYFRLPFIIQKEIERESGVTLERAWMTNLQAFAGSVYVIIATHLAVLAR